MNPNSINPIPRRHPIVGLLFGLWLAFAFLVRLYSEMVLHGGDESFVISVAAIIWPPALLLFGNIRLVPRGIDRTTLVLLFIFALIATLSCVVSPIPIVSLGFVAATLAGIYVAMLFSTTLTEQDVSLGLKLYTLLTIAALITYAWYDHRNFEGYRLGEGTSTMNPNSIGMVAMSAAIAAFSFRNLIIRLTLLAPSFWVIYATGSRAAAVATILATAIVLWFDFMRASLTKKMLLIVPLLAALTWYIGTHWDTVYLALDGFFQWDDRQRGLASGGSGRTQIWAAMWEIIQDNLLIGVGYRAHSEFLTIASSAHNGYLALFAEVGIFGFLAIMFLVLRRLATLLRRYFVTKDTLLSIYCGFFSAFLLLAMFERYLLNIGNPASLLFLFILFGKLSHPRKPTPLSRGQKL